MSGSEIKVTFGALASGQTDIKATVGRIETQLADLKKFLTPMVSTWTGQAAENYQLTQRKWDNSAKDLVEVLNRIGIELGKANSTYQEREKANAARWMN